jgi:transcriptional regulator with XRE-family HTH domain
VPTMGTMRLRKMLVKVLAAARPSLEELAREVGVSYRAMQSYAKGKRASPPAVLKRLVAVLGARGRRLQQLAEQLKRQGTR